MTTEIIQLISAGKLKEGLEKLIAFLESDPKYSDLLQVARNNLSALSQLKIEVNKGKFTPAEELVQTSRITDNVYQIVKRLDAGVLRFDDSPTTSAPSRRNPALNYIVGATVLLLAVFMVFRFTRHRTAKADDCPQYGQGKDLRIMVLPFKQNADAANENPEFDISDGLNALIERTPGLGSAQADVNQKYDVNQNYPNPSEAEAEAQKCNVQMIVWGRVNKFENQEYKLDVHYKLLDAGRVRFTGDTTVSKLLTVTSEGGWERDAKAITRMLYMVIVSQKQLQLSDRLMAQLFPVWATTGFQTSTDTVENLIMADLFLSQNKPEKALEAYNKVLAQDPNNITALTKRGALLYAQGSYLAAARDLEAVPSDKTAASSNLKQIRTDAYLKSGQVSKAAIELKNYRPSTESEQKWQKTKTTETADSTQAIRSRLDKTQSLYPNLNSRVDAAQLNLSLGDKEKALNQATEVLKQDARNTKAIQVAVDASLQKGDTATAQKIIQNAQLKGVDTKVIEYRAPVKNVYNRTIIRQ